jgi:hypothetical protein
MLKPSSAACQALPPLNPRHLCMSLKSMPNPLSKPGPAAVPTCTNGPETAADASYDWPNCATGADQETCDAVCNCGFVPTSVGAPNATCNVKAGTWDINTGDNRSCEAGEWARAHYESVGGLGDWSAEHSLKD